MTLFKNIFKCTSGNDDDDHRNEYVKLQLRIDKLQQDIMKLYSLNDTIQNKIDILIINLKLKN